MAQGQPQTIAQELWEKVDSLVSDPSIYMSQNITIKRYIEESKKLYAVDPVMGLMMLIRLHTIEGGVEKVLNYYEELINNYAVPPIVAINSAVSLKNLGFFSEAKKLLLVSAGNPKSGIFSDGFVWLVHVGAYRELVAALKEAASIGIEITSKPPMKHLTEIVDAMNELNISDDVIIRYLDLAGEVLRSKGYLASLASRPADVLDMDDDLVIYHKIFVQRSPDEIADMNIELMSAIVEKKLPHSNNVLVAFEPLDDEEQGQEAGK